MPRITGRVVEQYTRRPVAGARVQVAGFFATTGADGTFSIESPYGSSWLTIKHREFQFYKESLNVMSSGSTGDIAISSKVRAL